MRFAESRVGTRNEMIGTLVQFGHHCGGPIRNFWMLNSELRYMERSSQLVLPGSGCKTETTAPWSVT